MGIKQTTDGWTELMTQIFLDRGRYFIPERQHQIQVLVEMTPGSEQPAAIIDLCCGEGLLAEALLEKRPQAVVYALDGSPEMLDRAQERNARFGDRFRPGPIDLFERRWPALDLPLQAVVSSLAIHHLGGPQKQVLFQEVFSMLAPGGAFAIADIVWPASPAGWQIAAQDWDEAVRMNCVMLDGNEDGFQEFERQQWNTYRYFDPNDIDQPSRLCDMLQWLEQTGFADVDVVWMRAGHAIFGGQKP